MKRTPTGDEREGDRRPERGVVGGGGPGSGGPGSGGGREGAVAEVAEGAPPGRPLRGLPVRVICNPASGGGAFGSEDLRRGLEDLGPEFVVTGGPGDAERAAQEWGSGLLVVAGGDGTVNEAVNGLGRAGFPEGVTLALVPLGTGNDLAATLGVPSGVAGGIAALRAGPVRELDVARIRSEEVGEKFFVNVATGGLGARVSVAAADAGFKGRWGRFSYLRASLGVAGTFGTFEAHRARLTFDGEEREVRAANVAVANGRYAGGGWPAAPRANPEDGLLDVVVVGEPGLAGLFSLVPRVLLRADYLGSRGVFSARARRLRVETDPPGRLEFNADGELIGRGPAEFSVVPRALKVVVGEDYTTEPGRRAEDHSHAKSTFARWGTGFAGGLVERRGRR